MKVKKVAIVGGGSAAWLAAAYLTNNNTMIDVVLIDKEIGNPIGVGEATLLLFPSFMTNCGFHIDDWFPEVEATYKYGVHFPDWVHKGNSIWHSFVNNPRCSVDSNSPYLLDVWTKNKEYDYKTFGTTGYNICVNHNRVDMRLERAYHLNAGLLVNFLQKKVIHKIDFIQSEVMNINRDENDYIKSLNLKNNQVVEADLFIDCTGFASLLNPTGKKVSLEGRVFTDTAVACQIEYIDKHNEMKPFTTAHAVDHGWIWQTPIQTRIGSGLIFNRNITSIDEAKRYFVDYWGEDRVDIDKVRVIDWTPFYNPEPWTKNIVSVGLSAGFVEPLESTGLALIMDEIKMLSEALGDLYVGEVDRQMFNSAYVSKFEDCVDFVSMHYMKTERTEPFWNFVRDTFKPTDRMLSIIEMLNESWGDDSATKKGNIFGRVNWICWLHQLGFNIGEGSNFNMSKEDAKKWLMFYYNTTQKYLPNMSLHHATEIERLRNYYGLTDPTKAVDPTNGLPLDMEKI